MSSHWESVINGDEFWPTLRSKRDEAETQKLRSLFILYVDKTLSWLDYFIRDPRWLNLSAVNYAANAAREAANEVRDARKRFELAFELERDDLVPGLRPKTSEEPEPEVAEEEEDQAAA